MDVAYVSAFAALRGSVVGGLISGIATWLAQRSQILAVHRAHQISIARTFSGISSSRRPKPMARRC